MSVSNACCEAVGAVQRRLASDIEMREVEICALRERLNVVRKEIEALNIIANAYAYGKPEVLVEMAQVLGDWISALLLAGFEAAPKAGVAPADDSEELGIA